MTASDRIEIRPKILANSLKLLALLAFLVPASAFAAFAADDLVTRAVGALGVVFFGGGGAFALWSMLRTPWTMAVTPDALEIRVEKFVARAPWRDIEAVGLAEVSGQTMPSIRLATYDGMLASLTPDARAAFERRWGAMKTVAGAAMLLTGAKELGDHARADGLAAAMQANRGLTGGYDISFAWNQLDRPAKAFAEWLEAAWRARR